MGSLGIGWWLIISNKFYANGWDRSSVSHNELLVLFNTLPRKIRDLSKAYIPGRTKHISVDSRNSGSDRMLYFYHISKGILLRLVNGEYIPHLPWKQEISWLMIWGRIDIMELSWTGISPTVLYIYSFPLKYSQVMGFFLLCFVVI